MLNLKLLETYRFETVTIAKDLDPWVRCGQDRTRQDTSDKCGLLLKKIRIKNTLMGTFKTLIRVHWKTLALENSLFGKYPIKHCQRHNGPEG